MAEHAPAFQNLFGAPSDGMDLLPKPAGQRLPLLMTGSSQQTSDWLAQNGDGWMTYPRPLLMQAQAIADWRHRIRAFERPDKPVMQPLYIDLVEDTAMSPQPIHLGFRLSTHHLLSHFRSLQAIGVNHVALNLRFNRAPIEDTIERIADDVLSKLADEDGER